MDEYGDVTVGEMVSAAVEQILVAATWVVWTPLVWAHVVRLYRLEPAEWAFVWPAVSYTAWELGATKLPWALAVVVLVYLAYAMWRWCSCGCERPLAYALAVVAVLPPAMAYTHKFTHYAVNWLFTGRVDLEHAFVVEHTDAWMDTAFRLGFEVMPESPFNSTGLALDTDHYVMGVILLAVWTAVASVVVVFVLPLFCLWRRALQRAKRRRVVQQNNR